MEFKAGQEFRPDGVLKRLYYAYTFIAFFFVFLFVGPVVLFAPPLVGYAFAVSALLVLAFVLYWIPLYWESISYLLGDDELVCRSGVWFKKKSVVPYGKITNVDVVQGPISRSMGIASLKVQTAGYSGNTASSSELRINGIKEFEGLQEKIMELARSRRSAPGGDKVLKELIRIRKALEKR
jgi:membrane protein YdbS with pleckstrin-like domain